MKRIQVTLQGHLQEFFLGAKVSDLWGRLEPSEVREIKAGHLCIVDSEGHPVGDEGALENGQSYFLVVCPV